MIYFIFLNREFVYSDRLEDILSRSFSVLHVKYSPFGLLKRNCQRVIEQLIEWMEEEKQEQVLLDVRADYDRCMRRLVRVQKVFSSSRNRRQFMLRYYNFILSLNGCGLLHGYGLSSHGGKGWGDAERQSYSHGDYMPNRVAFKKEGRRKSV